MEVLPHFNLPPPPPSPLQDGLRSKTKSPPNVSTRSFTARFISFLLESYYKKAERKQVEIVGGELVKVEADLFYFRGEL